MWHLFQLPLCCILHRNLLYIVYCILQVNNFYAPVCPSISKYICLKYNMFDSTVIKRYQNLTSMYYVKVVKRYMCSYVVRSSIVYTQQHCL